MVMERIGRIVLGVLLGLGATTAASARVCGDADGNSRVNVTDGVQVLRSAVGLSSSCAANPALCDVDGSGTTTVSDGVNVLRKSAGLAIADACPSGATAEIQAITDVVVPFLTIALSELQVARIANTDVRAAGTGACPGRGSRTTTRQGDAATVTLDGWPVYQPGLGCFALDGSIQMQLGVFGTVSVALELTDLGSSQVVAFEGTVGSGSQSDGGFVFDGGPVIVRGDDGREIVRVTFDALALDGEGRVVEGSVEADDTSSRFDVGTVRITIQGRTAARVHVVRDDGGTQDYELDLQTGELTPAV
jgi:hypothetical protein